MYEYFIGTLFFGIFWAFLFAFRRDLRWPMIWTAAAYILFSGILVSVWHIARQFVYLGEPIVPSYWYPPTFFDLGRFTGFGGIEDLLWLFFIAGISTAIYEFLYRGTIIHKRGHRFFVLALIFSFASFFIFEYFFAVNLVYSICVAHLVGALVLWIQRRDLIKHSLFGASAFLIVYFFAFLLVLVVYPSFISDFYNLNTTSSILFLGIPLEEFLYAFSFGLFWGPLYEYVHGEVSRLKGSRTIRGRRR